MHEPVQAARTRSRNAGRSVVHTTTSRINRRRVQRIERSTVRDQIPVFISGIDLEPG
jgi:hypothetical protein